MADFDKCTFLFERWKNLALWRNLWTILVFVVGSALAVFLIMAIVMFLQTEWINGALSTLGTIANGAALAWILARRDQAVEEETEAKKEQLQQCSTAAVAVAMSFAAGQDADASASVSRAIEAVEKKLSLFGFR